MKYQFLTVTNRFKKDIAQIWTFEYERAGRGRWERTYLKILTAIAVRINTLYQVLHFALLCRNTELENNCKVIVTTVLHFSKKICDVMFGVNPQDNSTKSVQDRRLYHVFSCSCEHWILLKRYRVKVCIVRISRWLRLGHCLIKDGCNSVHDVNGIDQYLHQTISLP